MRTIRFEDIRSRGMLTGEPNTTDKQSVVLDIRMSYEWGKIQITYFYYYILQSTFTCRFPQEFQLKPCSCVITEVVPPPKPVLKKSYGSDQSVVLSTRSCCSTPKPQEDVSGYTQFSLDRKAMQSKHQQTTKRILVRNPPGTRIQSPEIISAHLGPNTAFGYIPENYVDKGGKEDDYGFSRQPSIRRLSERLVFLVVKCCTKYCYVN